MASRMTELGEVVDVEARSDRRRARPVPEMRRVQESCVAGAEKKALLWLAARTPPWIGPDHLTVLGFAAQVGWGGRVLCASSMEPVCAAGCDPLPGAELAGRLFGWHIGASAAAAASTVWILCRPHGRQLWSACAYGRAGVVGLYAAVDRRQSAGWLPHAFDSAYLATHTLGEFRLSFWRFGPTELRLLLAVGNLALLWKPRVHFLGEQYRLFDVGGAIGLAGMVLMLICFTLQNTMRLYREERVSP